MNTAPTQNQLRGRATGALFFAGFGALWLTLSLIAREIVNIQTVASVLIGLALLLAACAALVRESKRFPRMPDTPGVGRIFGWVNAAQWVAITIVASTLGHLHLEVYVPAAITAIVGLHLFPLARLFRYPLHNVTGAVLVAWAAAAARLVPIDHMQGTTSFGTGVILWVSAAISLIMGMRLARRSTQQSKSCFSPRPGSTARAS